MERETGIEPATSSLGSWRSTAELLPLKGSEPNGTTGIASRISSIPIFGAPVAPFCYTTQTATRRAVVQTSGHARSPRSPHAPSSPGPPDRDKIFPLPPGVAVAVPGTPQCRHPQRNLLKARVVVCSYNDHCSAPFSRAFWLVGTTKVYSGIRADIVMQSIKLIDLGFECYGPGYLSSLPNREVIHAESLLEE